MDQSRRPPAEWFTRWWEPREFFGVVQEHNRQLFPDYELLFHSDAPKFREAYAGSLFASILGDHETVAIKMEREEERFPDFYIWRGEQEKVYPFELVEAITFDYKRDEIFKKVAERKKLGQPLRLPRVHWLRAERAAVRTIQARVESKAKKRYNPSPCLLVYVSAVLFRDSLPFTVEDVANVLGPWSHSFPEAWCVWGAHVARFWPDPAMFQLRAELPDLLPK